MKRVITEYVRRDGDEMMKITTIADYTILDTARDMLARYDFITARRIAKAEQRRVLEARQRYLDGDEHDVAH